MKIAIMQPYFFPYIKYFELIKSVDIFVLYTDVNFRKNSWMHRNRYLCRSSNDYKYFGLKLLNQSSNIEIKDVQIDKSEVHKRKLINKIKYNYSKCKNFSNIFYLFNELINTDTNSLSILNKKIIESLCELLNIKAKFIDSTVFKNNNLRGYVRVIDICKLLNAKEYYNLPGGVELYDPSKFNKEDISLKFIDNSNSLSQLSILHLIFNYSAKEIIT